jgi:hypothetical protein
MPEQANASKNSLMWLWIVLTLLLIAGFAYYMFEANDKTVFMPGPMTSGHHQIELACDTCHTDSFTSADQFQKACLDCHGDVRKKPFDSHPASKFKDPRNADLLASINALQCISCHQEHQPAMTTANGLTQPVDFCIHCHKDIGEERASHQGMEFATCNNSGCHNFHNNRALYTDFLVRHLDKPVVAEKPVLPAKEFADRLEELIDYPVDKYPITPLLVSQADAPRVDQLNSEVQRDWLETGHASSGVNCTACHEVPVKGEDHLEWTDYPGYANCKQCHQLEVNRFQLGKHGMKQSAGLPPLQVSEARLPMKEDSLHKQLDCGSCHQPHRFDVQEAAVESCLTCHNDQHSQSYKDSPHYNLWQLESNGQGKPGTGVSCASCHMPRVDFDINDWMSRVMVDHNQNANLSPNEKMIRSSCLHCHGLSFTLDSLADSELIKNNFNGRPTVHIESMEMARRDLLRAQEEAAQAAEK